LQLSGFLYQVLTQITDESEPFWGVGKNSHDDDSVRQRTPEPAESGWLIGTSVCVGGRILEVRPSAPDGKTACLIVDIRMPGISRLELRLVASCGQFASH
jgi:hypothetical protein